MNGGNSGTIFSFYYEFVFYLKINMSRKTKISLRNLVFSNFDIALWVRNWGEC